MGGMDAHIVVNRTRLITILGMGGMDAHIVVYTVNPSLNYVDYKVRTS